MHGVSARARAMDLVDNSVLQRWVMALGLRHQGVLLTAVRGCDTEPKEGAGKALVRSYRSEVLNCHCGDAAKAKTFIEAVDVDELGRRMVAFLKNLDHYPHHYIAHLMHASEIVGYKRPSEQWAWFYFKLCKGLHVNPETVDQLDARLNMDEESFGKAAKVEGI